MPSFITRSVALLFTAASSFGSHAASSSLSQEECVGRAKFSLPADVEIAAISYKDFAKEIAGGAMLPEAQFSDGQRTGWTKIVYATGPILISNELDETNIADLRTIFSKQPGIKREYFKNRTTEKLRATKVSDLWSDSPPILSWSIDSDINYLQQLQNHLLYTGVTSDSASFAESKAIFETLSKNTSYRKLFSVPAGNGVCLPFAFIKDSGSEPREISIAYRLKSHPDVMIVLKDASADEMYESSKSRNSTPESEIENFWAQYEVSRTGREVKSRWLLNSKRTIELDGRKGLASFVNITRKDGSKDVGFLSMVSGDRAAKHDSPKLMLFVVREANHARAKGLEPMDEKSFLDLAERIAATVKVRRN